MYCADDVLLNWTLETYIMLFADVTLIHLVTLKKKFFKRSNGSSSTQTSGSDISIWTFQGHHPLESVSP